jgi:glycerol-3-phosphate cytidylyltransferase
MNDTQHKKRIGVTFSAFDLCHAGHMKMLKDAKAQCDYLIVGLQDDPSQTTDTKYRLETDNKLKNKPIMSLEERKEIIEAIKYVDEIFIYSTETDLLNWLKKNPYDVRILGSDWEGKKYTGWNLPHTPYFHKRTHNFSTSELRKRVYLAEKAKLESSDTPQRYVQEKVKEKIKRMPNGTPNLAFS